MYAIKMLLLTWHAISPPIYTRIRPLHGFALGLARYAPEITRHNAFALCFELEENNFYPQSFLQLRVKDLCLESELSERLTDR